MEAMLGITHRELVFPIVEDLRSELKGLVKVELQLGLGLANLERSG